MLVPHQGGLSKEALTELCKENNPEPVSVLQKLAETFNQQIQILFLPRHRPELNPIELRWGRIKTCVRIAQARYTVTTLEQKVLDEVANTTPQHWASPEKKQSPKKSNISKMPKISRMKYSLMNRRKAPIK